MNLYINVIHPKKTERFAHKPYILDGQLHNVTALVYTNVTFNCTPLADLEPYLKWLYHDASFGSIDDGNYETGTLIQVPRAKRLLVEIGGMCYDTRI